MLFIQSVAWEAFFTDSRILANFAPVAAFAAAADIGVAPLPSFGAIEVSCSTVRAKIDEFFTRPATLYTALDALVFYQFESIVTIITLHIPKIHRARAAILPALVIRI